MSGPRVLVVRTGAANIASIRGALERAGASVRVSDDPGAIIEADRIVLPGVGAFGAAVESLNRAGAIAALRARMLDARPALAICLGLQLLLEGSEESVGAAGLGLAGGAATRFPDSVRVPQLGWNRLAPEPGMLIEPGWAFYANSFRLTSAPRGWRIAWSTYAGEFVGAMQQGRLLACQFHPELSGAWGERLIARWLAQPVAEGEKMQAGGPAGRAL